ncbi:MAG TPA: tetratricopeptide repeat protein [bacterium]
MASSVRSLELDSTKKRRKIEEQTYLFDAISDFEDGKYEEAVTAFTTFTAVVPNHPLAHLLLARAYMALGKHEKAVNALFDHLRYVDDRSLEANVYLGVAYYELGRKDMARQRFEQAIMKKEDNLLVRENLALTRLETGKYEEALDDLLELKTILPEDQAINALLVKALGKLGKWETAQTISESSAKSKSYPFYFTTKPGN